MKKFVIGLFVSMFIINISAQDNRRSSRASNKSVYRTERAKTPHHSEYKGKEAKHSGNHFDQVMAMSLHSKYYKKPYHKEVRHYGKHNNRDHYEKHYNGKHHYKHNNYWSEPHYQPVVRRSKAYRLPHDHMQLVFNGHKVFFSAGLFYERHHDCYQEIAPPKGLLVHRLPYNARKIFIEGKVYYEYLNTIYVKVETRRGYVFEVVGEYQWN